LEQSAINHVEASREFAVARRHEYVRRAATDRCAAEQSNEGEAGTGAQHPRAGTRRSHLLYGYCGRASPAREIAPPSLVLHFFNPGNVFTRVYNGTWLSHYSCSVQRHCSAFRSIRSSERRDSPAGNFRPRIVSASSHRATKRSRWYRGRIVPPSCMARHRSQVNVRFFRVCPKDRDVRRA